MAIPETKFKIRISMKDAWIYLWIPDRLLQNVDNFNISKFPHVALWHNWLKKLTEVGFKVTKDPGIEKQFKVLSDYHRYGIWKDLEVKAEVCFRNIHFEFYQNIYTPDRKKGDGYYCSNKGMIMPYLIKLRFRHTLNKIIELVKVNIHSDDLEFEYCDSPIMAEEAILNHCHGNHWKSKSPKTLEEIGESIREYDLHSNSKDRDKKQITCGEVKYFRHWNGRLMRGRAYHNINNMWWVLINKYEYRNVAAFDLFDPTEEDFSVRRLKERKIPQDKGIVMASLKKVSTQSLRRELKRRKEAKCKSK
jgi:hypothetical protein